MSKLEHLNLFIPRDEQRFLQLNIPEEYVAAAFAVLIALRKYHTNINTLLEYYQHHGENFLSQGEITQHLQALQHLIVLGYNQTLDMEQLQEFLRDQNFLV